MAINKVETADNDCFCIFWQSEFNSLVTGGATAPMGAPAA